MTTESQLWTWLKKSRLYYRDRLHINRVENSVSGGMPDVEGCLDGKQFWIELKCEKRPTKQGTIIRPKFRPKQVPWLEKRAEAGGKAFVLLQVGQGQKEARRYLLRATDVVYLEATGWIREEEIRKYIACNSQAKPEDIIAATF